MDWSKVDEIVDEHIASVNHTSDLMRQGKLWWNGMTPTERKAAGLPGETLGDVDRHAFMRVVGERFGDGAVGSN